MTPEQHYDAALAWMNRTQEVAPEFGWGCARMAELHLQAAQIADMIDARNLTWDDLKTDARKEAN